MKYLIVFVALLTLAGCASAQTQKEASAPATVQVAASGQTTQAAASSTSSANTAAETKPPAQAEVSQAGFEQWLAGFRQIAARQGISQATLSQAFDDAELLTRVLELDGAQPEFTRAVWEYLDTAVSQTRIDTGRQRLAENQDAARAAQQRYGVPKEVLAAIWGIESNYGSNFGNYEIVDALATLGYHGRREDFAKRELLAALEILQNGDINRERMRGSWAGGMGHTQFLPTSFQAYAVDADGDGRRDIWASIPDVMASTANYLAKAKWREGEPWGVEVNLPKGFDYGTAESSTRLASGEWAALGVRTAAGGVLPNFDAASVLVPAGANGPAFLVGPNFRSILRYNNSTSYALAVGHLSDRIAGRGPIVAEWPRNLASLSRTQIKQLQSSLNAAGYSAGVPDGIMGPNTRKALRQYQRSQGLVADGYPTFALLQALQAQ